MLRLNNSKFVLILSAAALAMLLFSCGAPKAPEVKEWTVYESPVGFEFQYPKGWLIMDEANLVRIYPTNEAAMSFGPPVDPEATNGVEIRFGYERYKDLGIGTLAAYKDTNIARIKALNEVGKTWTSIMAKENAEVIEYKAKVSAKATIYGKRIVVSHDSVFYYLNFEAFNKDYEAYLPIVDSIIASVRLPKAKVTKVTEDVSKPSAELKTLQNDKVELKHPDNFDPTYPKPKGKSTMTLQLMGYRNDCVVTLDIFPSEKLSLEKVVEQNKGKFPGTSTGDASIDGVPAKFINYSAAKDVDGRAYFIVKGDKFYRVVITWYKPMKTDFLPAFEKVIGSLKLKG
ncbi:MAG: hypothetical protein NTV54_15910 [Ignavibacteriales bacterium]|nr:hypothetical protein [Ignavibacteriales bacterium]